MLAIFTTRDREVIIAGVRTNCQNVCLSFCGCFRGDKRLMFFAWLFSLSVNHLIVIETIICPRPSECLGLDFILENLHQIFISVQLGF